MSRDKPGPTTLNITDTSKTNGSISISHIDHNKEGLSHKKLTEFFYPKTERNLGIYKYREKCKAAPLKICDFLVTSLTYFVRSL
jgi:hypothetical protein